MMKRSIYCATLGLLACVTAGTISPHAAAAQTFRFGNRDTQITVEAGATAPHATCEPQKVHRYLDGEFIWLDGPNSTDVSYHATRAYYEMYAQLRREHSGLL